MPIGSASQGRERSWIDKLSRDVAARFMSFVYRAGVFAIAIAALAQAIIVKLYRLRQRNLGFRRYHRALIEENKWRAARWGIEGKLIDFGKREEVPMRDLAVELLAFVDDVVDDLRSRREVEYVRKILSDGTGAERQLQVYKATGDLRAVARTLVEETRESVEQSARTYHV